MCKTFVGLLGFTLRKTEDSGSGSFNKAAKPQKDIKDILSFMFLILEGKRVIMLTNVIILKWIINLCEA